MENKKYELVMDDSFTSDNTTLYRIKALRDFGNIIAGDLGGYIEGYHNLSQKGNCWIYDRAKVCGEAKVFDNAIVHDTAKVFGHAKVFDNVMIFDHVSIYGYANVYGNATIYNYTIIRDDAKIYGDATVYDSSVICNNADISSNNDYLFIRGLGSENRSTTAFRLSDSNICVNCGCYHGTLDAFEMRVNEAHGDNKYGKEYKMLIDMCKLHFGLI